jgi:alanyl-tRNA synthetase
MKKLEDILSKIKAEGKTCIEPQDAFMLYDTYGFPVDLTEDAALEQGLTVDRDALEALMEEQRERGRQSGKTESNTLSELVLSRLLDEFPPTVFKGYELLKCFSKILTFIEGENSVPKAGSGQVFIITDQTVFYAESGGQTSDHGSIKGQNGECRVTYVKKAGKWYIHSGELRGILRQGETVHMEVDEKRRLATARNHSATHLLHKALHTVLGSHAQQKGSLVEPHRLRFDFSHLAMVSAEEQQAVENMVNEAIWSNLPVKTQTMSLKEAKQSGAEALFNEKYGDSVRVVMMGDYSKELCGGTHVEQTGRIGLFKITSEGSVGSGLRRIEAITGSYALDYFNRLEKGFLSAAGMMKVKPDGLTLKIRQLNSSLKEKDKEIERLKADLLRGEQKNLADLADNINGTAVLVEKVTSGDVNELRQSAEKLKDQLGSAVVLLAAPVNDKIAIVCFVSKNLLDKGLHAGRLVETTAKITGGGGGGRADMAQAGGKNTEKLPEALNEIRQIIINLLNQ